MGFSEKISSFFALLRRFVDRYTWRLVLGAVLIIGSIVLVTEPAWFIAALDSLRIPYAVFLVVFITIFFIRGNNFLVSSGVIALLILAPGIWPYFKTAEKTPLEENLENNQVSESDFSVLHFNVKENNKRITSVAEAALNSNADIVSMQELKENSLQVIDTLMRTKYPYCLSDLSIKGFGLALYSKYPIDSGQVIIAHEFPMLVGRINIKGKEFNFISATTSTPTNEKDFQKQIKQFKFITEYANKINGPLILMGDMNSAPWSNQIESLLKETNLKDSRKDLSATYPAQSPVQIPIDYIFHSQQLFCEKFNTLEQTSSNHLGIMGYYTFKESKKNTDTLSNKIKGRS